MARRAAFFTLLGLSAIFGTLCGLVLVYSTDMPQMRDLERYRPNTTTQLLDVKGRPFGSFALERRIVVPYKEFPPVLKQAIFAIEDKSFERNAGVNLFRAFGAAYNDLRSGGRRQGASTLTMQLARNLFLSADRTWSRKLQEIILSIQIERHFTKDQIFALYANQIYLGSGTYGFEAGSRYYFGKHVHELTLPEAALLAALPKGPTPYSPIHHPDRALRRRNLVLSEMLADKRITQAQYQEAKDAPLGLHIEPAPNVVAPYFVEEVRRQLENQYGPEQVHGAGMKIYTTLDLDLQLVAEKAVLKDVADYERRHGWKGHLQNVAAVNADGDEYRHPDWRQTPEDGAYFHALVTEANRNKLKVKIGKSIYNVEPSTWAWTQFTRPDQFLKVGDIVYVRIVDTKKLEAALEQDSGAQAALMAVDNATGEVLAMVGGRDFALSQFNRATQAERQVGSSFKPYVYTAAMEHGSKPTDIVVDAPTTFSTPGGPYTPHNYEPDYKGAMTLTMAFAESRNIPALKLANTVGIRKVIEIAHRFGITAKIQPYLPVALGAASISLDEQVSAYSVFPNDGIRIEPHYIRKIVQSDGLPLPQSAPKVQEVISVDVARNMMKLLEAVPQYGTGAQAGAVLKHPLGGKTGTTNNYTDAWFVGFSPSVTCGTWIGYDDRKSLGEKETGARAALPMWIDFMKAVIERTPVEEFPKDNAPKKSLSVAVNSSPEDTGGQKPDEDTEDTGTTPASKPAVDATPLLNDLLTEDSGGEGKAPPAAANPKPQGTGAPVVRIPAPVPIKIPGRPPAQPAATPPAGKPTSPAAKPVPQRNGTSSSPPDQF
ncbi:MAG: PBP1A family penicillin-binding protein [Acidobacteria bacterium]|nr:PBP1A family penicillin-binding protein [Acidobacteriota bacterium]